MQEILPGVYHWTTFHEGIGQEVHSYLMAANDPPVLIDPRVPAEGIDWFRDRPPRHAYLTNRHHYRHGARFEEAFGTRIWCHREGLHEFGKGESVTPFEHGDELPGGILALEVGVICPEETALYSPLSGGVMAIGDALIRTEKGLDFVPDFLLGDDPPSVKKGLCLAFENLLARDFDHLLFAHGTPLVGGAKAVLNRFLAKRPAG